MRSLLILLFITISLQGTAQQGTIEGPTRVQPGATEFYTVSFPSWNYYSIVSWSCTGGTLRTFGQFGCSVEWDNENTTGSIEVSEDLGGQSASLTVQVGEPFPSITPVNQMLIYGTVPNIVDVFFNFPPDTYVTYQWQEWSATDQSWATIAGENSNFFQPSVAIKNKEYRCLVSLGGRLFDELITSVSIPDLVPGDLRLLQIPGYNTLPSIATTSANGGYCNAASYEYVWEQSCENGPWKQIGAGASYPGTAGIIGNTKVRRRITCGAEILYSNELAIVPAYTTVDYENRNYVREIVPKVKGVVSWQQADNLSTDDKTQITTYLDGLGRPIQTIQKEASLYNGVKKDIVTPVEYDEAGRQSKSFLPYVTNTTIGKFKNDASTAQPQYVNNIFGESPSYALTEFDNSPLNRVTKTMLPGNSWAGNNIGISADYDVNTVNERVHVWDIGYTSSSIPATSLAGVYGDGQLFKNVSSDEKGKKVITYTDKSGNLILKKVQDKEAGAELTAEHAGWLCTYYVYDDFGRQRFIIPPKAVAYLDTHSWIFSIDVVNELCFSNEYDKRGRLVVKKSPGAEVVYMVYDQRDRLSFTQDGNQRSQSPQKWLTTLYDNFGRVKLTGLIDYNSTRDDLQDWVDNNTAHNNGSNDVFDDRINIPTESSSALNLVVDLRDIAQPEYKAAKSITFNPGFETEEGDSFIAEIDLVPQSVNNTIEINGNPLPPNNNLYTLTLSFYDDYSYAGAKTFSTNFTIDNSVPSTESETVQKSLLTRGFVTGTKVRLLDGGNTFLTTTSFYDDKGRLIQLEGDNHKGRTEETTTQYDFSGKVRSNFQIHRFDGNSDMKIFTRKTYDALGRVVKISKSINGTTEKDIASYSYNELGQLANKKLAPGFAGEDGPQLESLDYTYNIQGWLLGINKAYSGSGTGEGHYFGMELGYDKPGTPNFSNPQLNGNIAGNAWKTRGDNTIRKYDYAYDNANQLLDADFNQRNTSAAGWTKDKMNFTSNYSYDQNGNIKTQNQWGIAPGLAPVQIDKMVYHYDMVADGWTNRLSGIEEQSATASNGKLGDFKNGSSGASSQQYDYDKNANLLKDLNKEIGNATTSGIQYNFMNLPTQITFTNTNKVISYVYDASGNKLRKILDEPANGTIPAKHVETDYDEGFVYETVPSNLGGAGVPELQFFGHEEGRVRIITPFGNPGDPNYNGGGIPLSNGKQVVFDYFIKDHLTNVRMILTEEVKRNNDIATMEDADPNIKQHEESVFGQKGAGNEVDQTRIPISNIQGQSAGGGWQSNSSSSVSKLGSLTRKAGPNVLLKVMADDRISTTTQYYYQNNTTNTTGNNLTTAIITSLIQALLGSPSTGVAKGNSGIISNELNVNSDFLHTTAPDANNSNGNNPKAYLTVVFFNEQFEFVSEGSTALRVTQAGDNAAPLVIAEVKAPKNGYAYVYLSNESNEPVYFDNFQVTHERGRIIEENHYYSYGLKISGISSKAEGSILNNYGYQGDFSEHDEETALDEFDLRHYDPQIGRWTTTDPYEQFANPYTGMANNPSNFVDEDGGFSGLIGAAIGATAFGTTAYLSARNNHVKGAGWIAAGAALLGAGVGYASEQYFFGNDYGSRFGANFRSFYKGLFGGSGTVDAGYKSVDGLRDGTTVDVPEVWGNFKLPKLYSWSNDLKFKWQDYAVLKLVTEGLAAKNPEYLKMDRDVPPMAGPTAPLSYSINDKIVIRNPIESSNSITRAKMKIDEGSNLKSWYPNLQTNTLGSFLNITLQSSLNEPSLVSALHSGLIGLPQSKISIHFQKRITVPVKRLKVLGIKF